jgi:hypothetical protein
MCPELTSNAIAQSKVRSVSAVDRDSRPPDAYEPEPQTVYAKLATSHRDHQTVLACLERHTMTGAFHTALSGGRFAERRTSALDVRSPGPNVLDC